MIPILLVVILVCVAAGIIFWKTTPRTSKAGPAKNQLGALLHDSQSSSILEAISDGVVTVDDKGRVKMINAAAGYLVGWAPKDANNIDHRSVVQFCDDKGVPYDDTKNPFVRVMNSGQPVRDNNASIINKGSAKRIPLSLSVSPIVDRNGNITGSVAILRDISEERRAERQRGEFISTASHEMRTPVAAIEGYLALAMNDKVTKIDSKAREYLQKAHESTQHLGSLFQDLLNSSKAEDGRIANHPELIELSSFLAHISEDLRFSAQKKNLAVEYVVGTSGANVNATSELGGSIRVVQPLYHVYADPERLREVITNLFDNAVKYTDTGKISIGLTGDNNVVQMYVRDTGKGIPSNDIPHLFQKFYRVDSSDTRTIGGTGLGLFISRKIVELYNGRIWVESQQGKGSTFYINLPRLSSQRVAELSGKTTDPIVKPAPK